MITIVISLLRNATQESWTNNTGATITITYTVSYNNGTEELYTVEIPNGSNINLSRRTFTLRSSGKIVTTIGGPSDNAMLPFSFKVTCNNTNGTTKIERLIKRFSHLGDFTMRNLKEVELIKGNFNKVTNLQNSFSGCDYVTRIRVPETVINIRNMNRTFYGCTRLIQFIHDAGYGINDNINDMDYMLYQCSNFHGLRYEYATGQLNAMERIMYRCVRATEGRVPVNVRGVTSALESFAYCRNMTTSGLIGPAPLLTTMKRCYYHSYEEDEVYGRFSSLRTAPMPTSAPLLTDMREAYNRCGSLTAVNMPTDSIGLRDMGWAFFGCRLVKSIRVPSNWNSVEYAEMAFGSCNALTNVVGLPTSFPVCKDMQHMFQATSITSFVMTNAPVLKSMFSMFNHSTKLTTVTLPTTMNSLETMEFTFWECLSLRDVTMPRNMNVLNSLATTFTGTKVTNITLPASLPRLTTMKNFVNSNKSVTTITMPTSAPLLNNLVSFAWNAQSLRSVTFPSNATRIEDMATAFWNNENLTTVTLPSSMPNLGNLHRTFVNCYKLSSLNLPPSAPLLGRYTYTEEVSGVSYRGGVIEAFTNCHSLTNISLPSNATEITSLSSTFINCINATTIKLPSSLNNLTTMEKAFSGCAKLTNLTGPGSLPSLNNFKYTFNGCKVFNGDLSGLQTPRIQYNAGNFGSLITGYDNNATAWTSAHKPRFGEPLPPPPAPEPEP